MITVQPCIPMFKRGDRYEEYLTSCIYHIEQQEVTDNITVYKPHLSTPVKDSSSREDGATFCKNYQNTINELLDYGSTHADYTWIVEADIEPPPHTLRTLLSYNADIASAVTPFHNHRDVMMCGRQPMTANTGIIPRSYESLRHQLWTQEDNVAAGLYCVLIKKQVETRLQYNSEDPGDTNYWYNTRNEGYTHLIDPTIICGHLPQWPLKSYLEDPL